MHTVVWPLEMAYLGSCQHESYSQGTHHIHVVGSSLPTKSCLDARCSC